MDEIIEEFISGFCRTRNDTNTVCCEYTEKDGIRTLQFMDCAFETCQHHAACEIYKDAQKRSGE